MNSRPFDEWLTARCGPNISPDARAFAERIDAIPAAARKACNDGQAFLTQAHGDRAGVVTWGDPLCIREATKAGLCGSHYMAWYRHRQANGIDTRKDFAA